MPVVGVELTGTEPSQITWYKGKGIASVDDLDEITGQASLDLALAGSHGAYGVKGTADSLLPTLTQRLAARPERVRRAPLASAHVCAPVRDRAA